MSNNSMTITTPPAFQCYDCQGCGICCRGLFAVAVTAEEERRITAQGWGDDPDFAGLSLFEKHGGQTVVGHREDGSCVFLDEQGLCKIHARFGEPAKPLACRIYPFQLIPIGAQARMDIRYDCPGVASNRGRSITSYRNSLKEFLPQVIPAEAASLPAPPLYGSAPATWPQLCRITETIERFFVNESLSLTRRVLCAVNMAALICTPRAAELEGRKLSDYLDAVATAVEDAGAQDDLARAPLPGMSRRAFRQLVGLYGRVDRFGHTASLPDRLRASWGMLSGRGIIPPLREDFPHVDFSSIEIPWGEPGEEAAAVLTRYFRMRLSGMGFFGRGFYDRTYLEGLNALLLTYPLALWFARAYAAGAQKPSLDAASVEMGVRIVSHVHGISPVFNMPGERYRLKHLSERVQLRGLVVWYGS